MLKQESHKTKKMKKENHGDEFQYGFKDKSGAGKTEENLTSPKKLFRWGYCLFHGTPQEIPSSAPGYVARMASNGFFKKNAGLEDVLNVFRWEHSCLLLTEKWSSMKHNV